jgi:hypothetical protein
MKKIGMYMILCLPAVLLLAGCGGNKAAEFEGLVDETIAIIKKAEPGVDVTELEDFKKTYGKTFKLMEELLELEKAGDLSDEDKKRFGDAYNKLLDVLP